MENMMVFQRMAKNIGAFLKSPDYCSRAGSIPASGTIDFFINAFLIARPVLFSRIDVGLAIHACPSQVLDRPSGAEPTAVASALPRVFPLTADQGPGGVYRGVWLAT